MTSASAGVDDTLPLKRRLKLAVAVQETLTFLRVMPSNDNIHKRMSLAKRHAARPASWMLVPNSADITTEEVSTETDVPLRIYHPPIGTSTGTGVLYVHGGGFVMGGLESTDWLNRELAAHGFPVVSVDYRLAPECPYPGPLDDVQSGLKWLHLHLQQLGAERIAVAGDSAGGNLVAALCLRVAGDNGPRIDRQVLIYPGLDATLESLAPVGRLTGLSRRSLEPVVRHYAGGADPREPLISPLLAKDLSGLPSAIILTGEHDVLRTGGQQYAERLREAGVPVFFRQYAGQPHGFFSMPNLCGPGALEALDDLVRCLSE